MGANIKFFRENLLKVDVKTFAEKLEITSEEVIEIEAGNTELERYSRIFSALAIVTEEPIFNFFRPGHHLPRRTLQWLKQVDEEHKKAVEVNKARANREAAKMYLNLIS
jgi:DUF438 domain-containing protein